MAAVDSMLIVLFAVEEIKAFVKALDEYVPPKKGDA